MTAVDDLWYLADEARQRSRQAYHRLRDRHDDYVEYDTTRSVSRERFRTVAERIEENGLPYGSHTLAYQPSGEILLVHHGVVDRWVVPGGELEGDETFREGAHRELREEAGVDADLDGLGILGRVTLRCDGHETWGVLPIYEAAVPAVEPEVRDPDDEIDAARWFRDLPAGTRDREILRQWRHRKLGEGHP
jgi:8-oxo-dGTP diphosphatase